MKKLALSIAALAFIATSMTSCKKDYTCACSYNNGIADVTQDYPINNQKKKDAEEACDALGILYSGKCDLK